MDTLTYTKPSSYPWKNSGSLWLINLVRESWVRISLLRWSVSLSIPSSQVALLFWFCFCCLLASPQSSQSKHQLLSSEPLCYFWVLTNTDESWAEPGATEGNLYFYNETRRVGVKFISNSVQWLSAPQLLPRRWPPGSEKLNIIWRSWM